MNRRVKHTSGLLAFGMLLVGVFVGIGASNPFSQKTFAASLKLSYPLLSDHPNQKVIQAYGVQKRIGNAERPVAKGSFFLVGKDGIIRGKWLPPAGELFPNDALLDAAQELEERS